MYSKLGFGYIYLQHVGTLERHCGIRFLMLENNISNELPIESISFKEFDLNELELRFTEVGTMQTGYEGSNEFKATRPSNLTPQGEAASKKKLDREINLKLESMQNYVESVEQKSAEHVKFRKKLIRELEQRTREVKFYEKQCAEQQTEINALRNQLESSLRITQSGSKAFPKSGKWLTPNLGSNVKIPQLLLEIKNLQSVLDNSSMELRNTKDLLDNANMRIKVLQDALSMRSEEIGLSGHADLLAKVAQMKEEVSSLKIELQEKLSRLETAEENNHSLSNSQMCLETQINQIQLKLAEAQKEIHRSSEVDLSQHLRSTKQERDTLVEYIQKDMRKSTVFAKQVELLEHSIRSLQTRITDQEFQIADLTKLNEHLQMDHNQQLQSELISNEDFQVLQRRFNELVSQLQSKDMQLEMKTRQIEESERIRKLTSDKLTSYEAELLESNEQIFRLKSAISDAEHKITSYQNDNDNMRSELRIVKVENLKLKNRVDACEPKLHVLEPQARSFTVENKDLRAKVVALEIKISEYRAQSQLIADLQNEFLEDCSTRNDYASDSHPCSDSQRHAIWIGYPSLRNLGCGLYEKIRQLAQDLHKSEYRVMELTEENNRLTRDLSLKSKDWDDVREHMEKRHLIDAEKLSSALTETAIQEKDLSRLRGIENLFVQIHTYLAPLYEIESAHSGYI